jgi:hypothetical protein
VASRKRKANGKARTRGAALLRLRARRVRDESQPRMTSATAVAAEAWRTGVLPARRKASRIPHEDETIRVGDPDDDSLANEYVGEELPGGSTPTPDQSNVDEIGRAYGLQDEDSGALRTSSEVLARRDRRRFELTPPRRPRP